MGVAVEPASVAISRASLGYYRVSSRHTALHVFEKDLTK
jgi:hypothetical protein